MAYCSSCSHSIVRGSCGCGSDLTSKFSALNCPPAPEILPCRMRSVDGVLQPCWHSLHPLIPMFRELVELGVSDAKLRSELNIAENYYSTCQMGSDIYKAICFRAAAQIELQQEIALWQSQRAASIGYGSKTSIERPSLYAGYYGSLLKDLIDSHPIAVGIFV